MSKKFVMLSLAFVLCIFALSGCDSKSCLVPPSSESSEVTESTPPAKVDGENTVTIPEMPVGNQICMTFENEYNLDYYQGVNYSTFSVPKINIDTPTTEALNKKILSDFMDVGKEGDVDNGIYTRVLENSYHEAEPITDLRCHAIVDYSYSIRNNVLALCINYDKYYYMSETSLIVLDYYYDIENDKILSLDEYLAKQNITKQEIIDLHSVLFPDIQFSKLEHVQAVICYDNNVCRVYGPSIFGTGIFDMDLKNMAISTDVVDSQYMTRTYLKARYAYSWFDLDSMPFNNVEKTYKDRHYYKVDHPMIKTKSDLREYMLTLFDTPIVDNLMNNEYENYVDIDGELYCSNGSRGTDITKGLESYEVIKVNDEEFTFRVKVELNEADDLSVVTGYETNDFTLIKKGDRFVFSKYESIRQLYNIEKVITK